MCNKYYNIHFLIFSKLNNILLCLVSVKSKKKHKYFTKCQQRLQLIQFSELFNTSNNYLHLQNENVLLPRFSNEIIFFLFVVTTLIVVYY